MYSGEDNLSSWLHKDASQKFDDIEGKYTRMKAKMSKSAKRDPSINDGKINLGADKSNSTLNIENLEDLMNEESLSLIHI